MHHTDNFLEEVGISVTDQSNIVSSGSLVISIIDDAPLAKTTSIMWLLINLP